MMTLEEARNILGPKFAAVPDYQIQGLILLYSRVAHLLIDEYRKDPKALFKKLNNIKKSLTDKERHKANKMPPKATLDQKIKRHIDHTNHCKCRPMPEKIRNEIEKRIG